MKVIEIVFVLLITVVFPVSADSGQFQFVCDDFPPFAYKENEKLTGFAVEILQSILKELQIPDTIKMYPWKRAYQMALQDKNTLVFTAARTEERELSFKWVGPIAPRAYYLYKLKRRSDIRGTTLQELRQYDVGTIRGYAVNNVLLDKGFELGKNLQQVTVNMQNIRKIYADRIDLMVSFDLLLAYTVKGTGFSFEDFEKVFLITDRYHFYYAFNKETDDMIVARFQEVLENMKTDGRFDVLKEKYLNK